MKYPTLLFVFLAHLLHAQVGVKPSPLVPKGKTPQVQIEFLDSLSKAVRTSDYKLGVQYSTQSLRIAQTHQLPDWVVKSYVGIAQSYRINGSFDSALMFIDSAQVVAQAQQLKKLMPLVSNVEGSIYMRKSNNAKAVTCFYDAIEKAKAFNDSNDLQISFNYLGSVAFYRADYVSAASFYRRSREYVNVDKRPEKFVSVTDNIGLCYANRALYDSALYFQEQAVKKLDAINDSGLRAEVDVNIASTLLLLNRVDAAKPYLDEALAIHQKRNNAYGIVEANRYLGKYYVVKRDLKKAVVYLELADSIAHELKVPSQMKQTAITLADVYAALGDYKRASEKYNEVLQLTTDISKEENERAINELSAQYDYKEQLQKIELLTRDKAISDQQIEIDRNLKIIYVSVAVFLLLLSGVFIYRFVEKRKDNRKLVEHANAIAEQKQQIENQKAELQQRNQETIDSINYASRIQQSALPSDSLLKTVFPKSFVYFKPKDIVSGDFYWMREKLVPATATDPERRYYYFAVADCTGHGVPGAMMSVLGSSLLNQLVAGPVVKSPADILHELHIQVVVSLNENVAHRDSQDGMEVALLLIDPVAHKVTYAGAGRSLYYKSSGQELQTIRSDKFSIGDTADLEQVHFTQHEIELTQETFFYLTSDGIADQFGGPLSKKFMTKQLKELLTTIGDWPVEQQEQHFKTVFETWMQGHEQTDDVTLVGIGLS